MEEPITTSRKMLSPPIPSDRTIEGSQDHRSTGLHGIVGTVLRASALWSGLAMSKYIVVGLTRLLSDNISDFSMYT